MKSTNKPVAAAETTKDLGPQMPPELNEKFSNEDLNRAIDWLKSIAPNTTADKITADMVAAALKAINYDNDIADAELRGRNAKIEETVREKEADSDGVPFLGSADACLRHGSSSIFDIARGA